MTTLKDIAERTQFSVATVSRVLNYDHTLSVGDRTRKSIFQAAEELEYRNYKKKIQEKTRKLAIINWYTEQEELDDQYYLSIRLGAEKKAKEMGYKIERVYQNEEDKMDDDLSGVIAMGKFSEEQVKKIRQKAPYVCFVDCAPEDGLNDSVVADFKQAMHESVDHLLEKGHQKIGVFAGQEMYSDGSGPRNDPRTSYLKAYLKKKKVFEENFFYEGRFRVDSGRENMEQAIEELGKEELPSAIITGNDAIAIGCLQVLNEHNIHVPQDISIIGFNDIPTAKYLTPSLTTTKVYTEEMGKTGVQLLHERIQNGREVSKHVTLSTSLIERASTKEVT